MATIYLNGKFCAQRTTGVQRVAANLVRALDALPAPAVRRVLLCPPAAEPPALERIEVRRIGRPGAPLHAWEQVALPRAAADGLLVNLAGSAPAFARRQSALLHDAAVFDHPEAYTRAFVAWYRFLFRRLARRARPLFTVSAFSRERLALHLKLPPAAFTLLPNGCDHLDAVEPDGRVLDRLALRGRPYVLAVASANPTKNLGALVRAFARRADRGLSLVIVGGRNERVFAGRPGAADPAGVQRAGALDDAALKALYGAARGLVFPSRYEGFGLPPAEAMALGCPVAAASAGALPEVCGDAALYFDPDDDGAITAAIDRLAGDAALRARLRAAGLERATHWRWRAAAAGLAAALEALA